MTEQEFITSQGDYFFIRSWIYVTKSLTKKEMKMMSETNRVIFLTFPQGKWSIRFNDLKEKAKGQLEEFNTKFNFELDFKNIVKTWK